jgi:surface polysaccharide O-acyltransferase-like enzyme
MLSGYLLLQPNKVNEPLRVFFKKRWARIGLPFFFWGIIYFVWVWMFDNGTLSWASFVQSMLQGPYVTFWFLYMLVGLYLLTPLLRIFTAYANESLKKFVLILWFVGTGIMPLASLLGINISSFVFILPGWIGYYLLGSYLGKFKLSSTRWRLGLSAAMIFGLVWTSLASAVMEIEPGPQLNFFYDYMTANVMIASAAMFLLLTSISAKTVEKQPTAIKKVLHVISENTLPVYLFHMILLEAFQNGVFGFTLNTMTLDPVIMTPLLTVTLLLLSVCVIVPLKKVPGLKRLIG